MAALCEATLSANSYSLIVVLVELVQKTLSFTKREATSRNSLNRKCKMIANQKLVPNTCLLSRATHQMQRHMCNCTNVSSRRPCKKRRLLEVPVLYFEKSVASSGRVPHLKASALIWKTQSPGRAIWKSQSTHLEEPVPHLEEPARPSKRSKSTGKSQSPHLEKPVPSSRRARRASLSPRRASPLICPSSRRAWKKSQSSHLTRQSPYLEEQTPSSGGAWRSLEEPVLSFPSLIWKSLPSSRRASPLI